VKKSYVSSAQFKLNRGMLEKVAGEDIGWDIFKEEVDKGVERDHRSVSVRLMNVFTLIHLVNYHLVPVEDESGNPKTYTRGPKTGEFMMSRELCVGAGCSYCEQQDEMVFGKRLHWSLGQGHLEQLGGFARTIASNCASCGGEETIADPDAPKPTCSQCGEATPLSIFDCDISVKREGKGTKSAIQVARFKQTELSEELTDMAKPFDFKEIFAPDPVEIQAKLLRVRVQPEARGAHARDYA
jgi:hypothetical protein